MAELTEEHPGGYTYREILEEVRRDLKKLVNSDGVDRERLNNIDARVKFLEQWHTWMLRTVMGALIIAGLSVIGIVYTTINTH